MRSGDSLETWNEPHRVRHAKISNTSIYCSAVAAEVAACGSAAAAGSPHRSPAPGRPAPSAVGVEEVAIGPAIKVRMKLAAIALSHGQPARLMLGWMPARSRRWM